MLHALVAFAIFAAIITITPGLDTMLVIRTAAVSGRGGAVSGRTEPAGDLGDLGGSVLGHRTAA